MEIPDELLVALRHIAQAMDLHSRRLMAQQGLTLPQLTVLRALRQLTGSDASISGLSRQIHLRPATVTEMLARLEERGLLRRVRSETDRRCVLVSLTQAGESLIAHGPPLFPERLLVEFARLERWEQLQLLSSLQRLASLMDPLSLDSVLLKPELDAATH